MPYMSLNFFRRISLLDLSAEKGQRIAICWIDNSKKIVKIIIKTYHK